MKRLFLVMICIAFICRVQGQSVAGQADRQLIKIGEQIRYTLKVQADTLATISFPTQNSFLPLEMVEQSSADTIRQGKMWSIAREYRLTHFQAGDYTLPALSVLINGQRFMTDSLSVKVSAVQVDTLKQGLYPIKPMLSIEKPKHQHEFLWWWGLGILLLVSIVWAVYFWNKKRVQKTAKAQEQLPPFERALQGLKNLQHSRYLIENKHKEYYSELTDIVRKYLEEEVHLPATESTTAELLERVQALLDAGRLPLSETTISELSAVLSKADLVKFAKSKPHDGEAEADRNIVESIVIKTNQAVLDPLFLAQTELQKAAEQAQRVAQQKKRKQQALWLTLCLVGLGVLCTGVYWGKEWWGKKENDQWITSHYGYPPVSLTLHEPLLREIIEKDGLFSRVVFSQKISAQQAVAVKLFITNLNDNFEQSIHIHSQSEPVPPSDILQRAALEQLSQELSVVWQGENVLTKEEIFTTSKGAQGVKIFGTFMGNNGQLKQKMSYQAYYFTLERAGVLLLFVYKEGQESSALWVEKVRSSIDFPTQ